MEMAGESNEYLIGVPPPPPPPRKRRNRSAGAMRVHSYEPTAANSPMAAAGVCSQCVAEAGPADFEARVFRNPFQAPFPTSAEPLGKENYGSPMQQQSSVSPQTIDVLNQKVDDIYQALSACIQNHCVAKDELALDLQANREDLDMLLLQKANKQSVANALQRKANKQDLQGLEEKVGLLSLSISEMHHAQPDLALEQCRALCERQKEAFTELLHQDVEALREEISRSLA